MGAEALLWPYSCSIRRIPPIRLHNLTAFSAGAPENVGALFAIQVHNKAFLKATNCISQDKSSSTAFILKRKIYISFILF